MWRGTAATAHDGSRSQMIRRCRLNGGGKCSFSASPRPSGHISLACFQSRTERWLLSYIGVNKSYPPRGEVDFTAALERLATPLVHQMVRRMEPISPVYSARGTRNRWRHYERWRTPLGRFIALADAACSFNPRFGQGMSAATVSARLLQQCLARYGVTELAPVARILCRTGAISANAVAVRGGRRFAVADE